MVFRRGLVILSVIASLCGVGIARADHAPAIVVPGRPDVPVIINGRDARGAIVIGDWGLSRPGMPVTVIYRQPWPTLRSLKPAPLVRRHRRKRTKRIVTPRCHCAKPAPRPVFIPPGERHFYPGGPTPPRLGRLEDESRRPPPPKPAESFSRSWSTSSQPLPATIAQPPVIVAPTIVEPRLRPRRPRPPRPPRPPRRTQP
jgi:hypothetical protein